MEEDPKIFPFPEELLPIVFKFLPINDKLNASLVCKAWLFRLNSEELLNNICVRIPEEQIQNAAPFSRRFTNFAFENVKLNEKHLGFFKIFGNNIRKLKFVHCSMESDLMKQCSSEKYCRNLHVLEFYNTHLNIFPDLPDLKELTLFKNGYKNTRFTDPDIIIFGKTMPNLEKLVIRQTMEIKRVNSESALTMPIVYNFMKKRTKTLISLELDADNLIPRNALELFYIKDFKLKKLYIEGSYNRLNFIPEICFQHKTITALHLPKLKLDDSEIEFICYLLPLLESLTLRGNGLLNGSIDQIFRLKHLRYLDLSYCSNIRDENFQTAISVFECNHLRSLYLNNISIEDVTLRRLLNLLPSLRHLNLSCCRKVSNDTVRFISEKLSFLQRLSLSGCPNITDEGILAIHNPAQSISNLKELEELNLAWCSAITSVAIGQAIQFDSLRILHYGPLTVDLEEKLMFKNPSLKKILSGTRGPEFRPVIR